MTCASYSAIDDQAIRAFEDDGVVCLRGLVDPSWVKLAHQGVLRNLDEPGRFFRDHTPKDSAGRYVFDYWTWPDIPEFRSLIFDSPLAGIAGSLMRAGYVNLLMDNWFMRESGATNAAPWHHDEPYFDFEGHLCIVWLPCEAAPSAEGLSFVRGSHRWDQLFVAPQFSENVPFECTGDQYKPVPDIDADPKAYEFLSWDVEVADCLVFDFRTLHSVNGKDTAAQHTHHRLTLRFGAEDTLFKPRGPWTQETTDYLISRGQQANAPINCDLLPRVWHDPQASESIAPR